jgi:hypothetical protein
MSVSFLFEFMSVSVGVRLGSRPYIQHALASGLQYNKCLTHHAEVCLGASPAACHKWRRICAIIVHMFWCAPRVSQHRASNILGNQLCYTIQFGALGSNVVILYLVRHLKRLNNIWYSIILVHKCVCVCVFDFSLVATVMISVA